MRRGHREHRRLAPLGGSGSDGRRAVAAFDFDGTITRGDTLVPFLHAVAGSRRFAVTLARVLAGGADLDAGRRRDRAKATMLRHTLAGLDLDAIERRALAYASTLPARYRPDILSRLAEHQARGDRTVLVTASLGVYARPAAAALGFDDVIAVELERSADGPLTGAMVGRNVRGPEKAVRLRALLGSEPTEIWAYGNSAGDRDLLDMAHHPTWVR